MADHTYTISPGDIRVAWGKLMTSPDSEVMELANLGQVEEYAQDPGKVIDFAGMSGSAIADALANGYYPEKGDIISADARGFGEVMVPQILVNDEDGELLIGEVIAGEEEYLARWQDQPEQRGVRIRADITFHCGTKAEVIEQFYDWLLAAIEQFQRRGNAPAVELVIHCRDLYDDFSDMDVTDIVIPLVEEGEVIDPITWRAFLTRGAFRTLGFLAIGMVAQREGLTPDSGLGYPLGEEFGVIYDDEDGLLEIVTPNGFEEFPEEEMTRSLNRILERF